VCVRCSGLAAVAELAAGLGAAGPSKASWAGLVGTNTPELASQVVLTGALCGG
jgi:hypothetical protein